MVGLLALTALLLGGVVLPLGWETAATYRHDYADASLNQARALAAVAEERLSDHEPDPILRRALRRLVDRGQGVALVSASGATLERAGAAFVVPSSLKATTEPRTAATDAAEGDLLLSAVPIGSGDSQVGVVVLARQAEPLDHRIRMLWLTLTVVAVVAALAAIGIALWLSRWVVRPIRRLEEAANVVGAGNLEARAAVAEGPPEVRRLAAAFDAMAARLNSLVDGHRAVIADVSHQLRTPMSALRLRLELLAESDSHDSTELNEALDELNRLSRLVDGLLAVARAEATSGQPMPLDTRSVLADRVSAWAPLAAERGVSLTLEPGAEVRAWAVHGHLEQILDNLLGNCFDLTPPPQHVRLALDKQGDDALVTVADDGPGMTAAQRRNAFQRFETSHADSGGTGLGLAIVQRLITVGGGRVVLEETVGGGLTVRFSLPRVLTSHASW